MLENLGAQGAVSAGPAARGVRLREIRNLGKIDLRGSPDDRTFMSAVGRSLDVLLPTEPCTSARQGELGALWLGPDQWLMTCPSDDVASTIERLDAALSSTHAAITDVSSGRATLRLGGPNARDVLAKGCPLDLHPSIVKPGYVAGSVLAKVTALIHLSDADGIDLHIGRSFADYLWAWLEEAGREFGVTIE